MGEQAMEAVLSGGWITDKALIICEENANIVTPEGLRLCEARKYGGTVISIFER